MFDIRFGIRVVVGCIAVAMAFAFSPLAFAGTTLWSQDFNVDSQGLTALPATASVAAGKLEVSMLASESVYVEHLYAFDNSSTFSTELTLSSGAGPDNGELRVAISNSAQNREHALTFYNGEVHAVRNGASSGQTILLGTYQLDTAYQLEFIVDLAQGTTIRFYPLGADPATGYQDQMNETDWTDVFAYISTLACSGPVAAIASFDNMSETIPADLSSGNIALWQQNFTAVAAGLTDLGLHLSVAGGKLNLLGTTSSSTHQAFGERKYAASAGVNFTTVMSASAWGDQTYLSYGYYDEVNGNGHIASMFNGQWLVFSIENDVYTEHTLGAAALNTEYQVEIETSATQSTVYVYPVGQSRAQGYQHVYSQSNWRSIKTFIDLYIGSGGTVAQATMDNMKEVLVSGATPPPSLSITAPLPGSYTNNNTPVFDLSYSSQGTIDTNSIQLSENSTTLNASCNANQQSAQCTPINPLSEGEHTVTATVADTQGTTSDPASTTFTVDTLPPVVTITSPQSGLITNVPGSTVSGSVSEPVPTLTLTQDTPTQTITQSITADASNNFSQNATLEEGGNTLTVTATDYASNVGGASSIVTLDTVPPPLPIVVLITVSTPVNGQVTVTGQAGSAEANSDVIITNTDTQQSITVTADANGAFTAVIAAEVDHQLQIGLEDAAGNPGETVSTTVQPEVPPDPVTVAPPSDPTQSTPMLDSVDFLFTGANSIQTGVAPGTIQSEFVAVLRGQVLRRDNTPLSGVAVSVKDRPEFGQTLTRADGMFDLVVNGGGQLIIEYQRDNYLPVHRKVNAPWQDYIFADDVVMIGLDSQVTTIDLSSTQAFQVARGTVQTDTEGSRQATILFPQSTTATMILPGGSAQPLTTLDVRATEYTVGDNGPEAMPAPLPITSAYTYALELSVDEALAAGATQVSFSQPLPFYVENFLNFPTGEVVPTGYYDRELGDWESVNNGRIIEILSIVNNAAVIDVTGSGVAATQTELDALSITAAELQQLANLYAVGQSLWRVPISHFSTYDCNWPWGPPDGATMPPNEMPDAANGDPDDSDDDCNQPGCVIRAQSQVLAEEIPIVGTSYSLNYSSDRVPGRRSKYTIDIPLRDEAATPASLQMIRLRIGIAGREITEMISAAAQSNYLFEWDGMDVYGREVYGSAFANIKVEYMYPCRYLSAPGSTDESFGSPSDRPTGAIGTRSNCQSLLFARDWRVSVESPHIPPVSVVGGWSISEHHAAVPYRSKLYLGDGGYRSLSSPPVINTVAGNGNSAFSGDGGHATEAGVLVRSVLVDPANNLYIGGVGRIRRVSPDGMITTIAGTGGCCYAGDGGPAIDAVLGSITAMAMDKAGNLYLTQDNRVRRIDTNGIITTVVAAGDGNPATQEVIVSINDVAIDSNGNIYIADTGAERVWSINAKGTITAVAGTGVRGFSGDGGPATQARLYSPWHVAIDKDDSLHIVDSGNRRIRKVDASGIITTVVGNGAYNNSGDGGPATEAGVRDVRSITFDRFGNMYLTTNVAYSANPESSEFFIRRVGIDGIINRVAGRSRNIGSYSGDGGAATQAGLYSPTDIAVDALGDLYIADSTNNRVRRVFGALGNAPSAKLEIEVPSNDGSLQYRFDEAGRHVQTVNALTGAIVYSFGRDSSGRLTSITDVNGDITIIERNASEEVTAIIAADGQRTEFTMDANGYLATVTNPANEVYRMTYSNDGLMTEFRDRRNQLNSFQYDALGYLTQDINAGGGGWVLNRETIDVNQHNVRMTSAENRVYEYRVEEQSDGDRIETNISPDGATNQITRQLNGITVSTFADGTELTIQEGPDPRFNMQAPVPLNTTVRTPSGLTFISEVDRDVSLSNSFNPLSLISMTDTTTTNGRQSQTQYTAATRTFNRTSAVGRTSTTVLDAQGRISSNQVTGLASTAFAYDLRGRLEQVTEGSGTSQRLTALNYYQSGAQAGFLQSITDAENRTVSFEYDAAGRVTRQTLPDSRVVQYTYNANGNVTSITPPGQPAHVFAYNAFDLEGQYTPPAVTGITTPQTVYAYNLDKQLELITRPDNQTLDFQYNPTTGQLTSLVIPTGTYQYTYLPTSGLPNTVVSPDAMTLTYGYDGFLLTDTDWSGVVTGSLDVSYNNDFLVSQRCVNTSSCISLGYDNDSLLTSAGALTISRDPQRGGLITDTTLNTTTTVQAYNEFAELETVDVNYGTVDLYDVSYSRDNIGRIATKTETVQGVARTEVYGYDTAGRLETVTRDGVVTSYAYDSNGNRLSRTQGVTVESGIYDDQDRLTSYDGCNYTYTDNGELATRTCGTDVAIYNYDVLGNLQSVALPNGDAINYIIDGQDRRVGKQVDGVLTQAWLYQDQLNPIAELNPDGSIRSRFVYADKINVPAYMIRGGVSYRIISDHLGSPRLIVNTADGTIAQRIDYDEFGRVINDTNPGFQPFGFAGGLYDQQTGLVRFGARDYDAQIGRWAVKDKIKFDGGMNLYGYAFNDPVNLLDLNGERSTNIVNVIKSNMIAATMDMMGTVGCVVVCIVSGGLIETAGQVTSGASSSAVQNSSKLGKFCKAVVGAGNKIASRALGPAASAIGAAACVVTCF